MQKTAFIRCFDSFLKPAASLCAAAILFTTYPAFAQERQPVVTRNVRKVVANQQVPFLHPLAPTETLKLSIALPLRDETGLDELLKQLYNPASLLYHEWLSVGEFTDRFGPTPGDYEAVVQFAEANGMTIRARTANRFLVDVDASVAQINQAFHVTMGVYQHPTEPRTFYAPDRQPTLDLPVEIWHIGGLDNYSLPKSHLKYAAAEKGRAFTTGSGPNGTFLGSDIRAAYYGGTALTGAGQSIGIFADNYNLSDIQAYFNSVNQPFNPNVIQNYSTDGRTNTGCNNGSGCTDDGEVVIDVQQSLSMAPGVNSVILYFGNTYEDTFNAMATHNVAKQLSTSIEFLPADPQGTEPIFKEFAAQGQNLFVASGDGGAFASGDAEYYPVDDPYVTTVGGTDLTTNGPGGSWQSESAWVGSGGGVSNANQFPIPAYQQLPGVINSSNGGSTTLRNFPDVAAEANTDNFFCANGSCRSGVGGTSLAAPRWAGFLALVNQQRANNGQSSLGFLNPLVYAIGTSSSYGNAFHDITTGNNDNSRAGCNAVPGYDLVTGWGTPNGQGLIDQLAHPTTSGSLDGAHVLAPASSPGLVLDDQSSSTASGNPIQIWPTNGTGAQSWVFSSNNVQPAGFYNIAVSYGPYCVTASGSSSGSLVNLQPCNGSPGQAWQAVTSGSGYIFHPANNTGLCLDVRSSGTAPGTPVQAWTCNSTNAQLWSLK